MNEIEKNIEHIYQVIPSGIFTVDKNKRVTSWNNKAAEITGYSKEEVLGKECLLFAEQPCRDKCGLYSDDVTKPISGKECIIRRKDGERRVIYKNADVLRDEKGNIVGGIESFEDITDVKNAQGEIKHAEEEWSNTFNAITDIIFILDKDQTIRRVNKIFLDSFNLKMEDVVGKKCYEIVHKSNMPWHACPHMQTMKDNTAHTEEVDDPVLGIPLLVSTYPILNEKGECTGSVHIAKDISGIKKVQNELSQKIIDLERFQKATIGREKRIIELKEEVKKLKQK